MKVASSAGFDVDGGVTGPKRVRQDQAAKPPRVQVLVRMRPALEHELGSPEAELQMCHESNVISMTHFGREYTFGVDRIFGPDSSQEQVYQEGGLDNVVASVMQGTNACVFAYGCSGTGKTFTMQGGEGSSKEGVIPIAVRQVLQNAKAVNRRGKVTCSVVMSLMEIYNDKLRDLLTNSTTTADGKDLAIREDYGGAIRVPGLTEKAIESYEEFESIYSRASAHRKTSATGLNNVSSRSHAVLMIKVVQEAKDGADGSGGRTTKKLATGKLQAGKEKRRVEGKLNMIDLAGSERNSKTGNRGERLQESGNINLSLFVLGKVIDGLNSGDSRIPYRDSKLTRLLQDSLHPSSAGSSTMICCIAPSAAMAGETCQSLGYASKARSITNRPKALHPGDEPPPAPPTPLRSTSNMSKPASSSNNNSQTSRLSKLPTTTALPPPKFQLSGPPARVLPAATTQPRTSSVPQQVLPPVKRKRDDDGDGKENEQLSKPSAATKIPAPAVVATSSTTVSSSKPAASSSHHQPGNESMVAAKDMIVQARDMEKEGRLDEALRLYEAAALLLPGHQKLTQRLNNLRQRIRSEKEAKLSLPTASMTAFSSSLSSSSSMELSPPGEDSAELLHSALKDRQERVRALSKMRSEEDDDMMAVDFGGEMEQEDDSDAYLDQPPSSSALAAAMGSMTPPQAIIDPAEKLECLKSLHKEIKNVLEAEIVEILNQGSSKQLLKLHGIGKKRADHILQMRAAADAEGDVAFKSIDDLGKIGLTTVMIAKILRLNAMQRLEVCN